MNPRMLVEFVDGSKTMVEMSCIANATGLVPDSPGMHGPDCWLDELAPGLCPVEDGGVLSEKGLRRFHRRQRRRAGHFRDRGDEPSRGSASA